MIELALLIALSMILPPAPQRPAPEPVCIVEPARPYWGDERFRAAHERHEARRQREACGCGPAEGEGRQEGRESPSDGDSSSAPTSGGTLRGELCAENRVPCGHSSVNASSSIICAPSACSRTMKRLTNLRYLR